MGALGGPFQLDIDAAARANDTFRTVLHTTGHVQVVAMSLKPGEEIGTEVHDHNDQVLVFVEGTVRADVAGASSEVSAGQVFVVPAGTKHNFTNIGPEAAKLYTIYGPPDHAPDTVHATKADADAAEDDPAADVPPPEHD